MGSLASLGARTLKNIIQYCGLSFTGCTEKPDLVARADMALAVKRRKVATLTLQRAAHAKIAAMDSARLARVQSALTERTVILGKLVDLDAILVQLHANTRLACLMLRTTARPNPMYVQEQLREARSNGVDDAELRRVANAAARAAYFGGDKIIVSDAAQYTIFDHKYPDECHYDTVSLDTEIGIRRIGMFLEPPDTDQCAICLEPTAVDYHSTTDNPFMIALFMPDMLTFQCGHCLTVVCNDCCVGVFGHQVNCPVCRKNFRDEVL